VQAGGHASINLLCFPGVTDTDAELDALCSLIERTGLHRIQLRNLNLDPALYRKALPRGTIRPGRGMRWLRDTLAQRFPQLGFAYFNPAVRSKRASLARSEAKPSEVHRNAGRVG